VSAPPPSPAETLSRLGERSASFRTVRAVLDLVWRDDAAASREECRASLSWVRPDSLRLRGTSAAFFTVFDLCTDARRVRLDVPREQVAVFGERQDPAWDALPLSAEELMIALLADPCSSPECRDSVAWADEARRVLAGPGWTLELEPDTWLPASWRRDDPPGREIRWSDWVIRDGVPWPLRIDLIDATRQESLEVRMGKVDLDRPVPANRFSLAVEPDREILTPGEARTRWERRQGGGIFHPE
jgi:hypothetical protein